MPPVGDPYTASGACLLVLGSLLSLVAYFIISSTPLTALGISAIIIGIVLLAIRGSGEGLPHRIYEALLSSSLENIALLVEGAGGGRAIYLPSSTVEGGPLALVPLSPPPDKIEGSIKLKRSLIVRYGGNPGCVGILVSTPGSVLVRDTDIATGSTASDVEAQLTSVLVGELSLADGVSVSDVGDTLVIEVSRPNLGKERLLLHEVLGSPITSIIASIAAEVLGSPVELLGEEWRRDKLLVRLKVLGGGVETA